MLKDIKLMNYEEYINSAEEEEFIFINELYEQGQLLESGLRDIINIDKPVNLLVITSTRCRDSATIMPFLIKLSQFNENINVKFLLKKENEDLLSKLCGELNIPAIIVLDSDNNMIRKFIEFPKEFKEILIKNSNEKTEELIEEMRKGKYNQLIQDDLVKLITGKKYEYISFKRVNQ